MSRIEQTITIKASPAKVYAALMDERKHAELTGAPAAIDARAGGAWSAYGGKIGGFTLELVPGERIVQAWRAGDWAAGVYSLLHLELSGDAESTTIRLEHEAVPDAVSPHIDQGWHKMYWEPLARFVG